MTEINEIVNTMVPVFMTAIVCPSICLMVYYMYKARLSFSVNTKHIYTDKKKKKSRERN